MGYFYRVVFIVLLASYVCGEINEDNEDSNVLEQMMWRQATDVGELLADVKALIMGQEHQMQEQQQMKQQLQELQQQIRRETQPLKEQLQEIQQQQQEFQQRLQQQKELEEQQRNKRCKTTEAGTEYTGTLTGTSGGNTCLRWDSFSYDPHTASEFPDATVAEAANYCRNPNNRSPLPFCWYTTSNGLTALADCDVPFCL